MKRYLQIIKDEGCITNQGKAQVNIQRKKQALKLGEGSINFFFNINTLKQVLELRSKVTSHSIGEMYRGTFR